MFALPKGCRGYNVLPSKLFLFGNYQNIIQYSSSKLLSNNVSQPLGYGFLVRQIICAMLQDRSFDKKPFQLSGSRHFTVDAVIEILRVVPRFFFQSSRSIGRQKTFRRRAPLKQRDLQQEAEDMKKGERLHGPAAYRDYAKVDLGLRKALEFYMWVEENCDFLHNETTCREMACVLAKGNDLRRLWQFLHGMVQRDSNFVNTMTLTCIIKILGEEGLVKEALSAFYRMKEFHCKPDVISYNTIIGALCRVGYFKKARLLLEQMELPGFRCPPDAFTYTILIGSYCKYSLQTGCRKAIRRRLWEASHLFRHMHFRGFMPDVVTYNCMIDGLCKTNRIERALELFEDMIQRGCTPNKVTYNSFIRYYSIVNEVNKAAKMISLMKLNNHGIPSSSSYTPIIHALCEARRPLEALNFLMEMVNEGCIPREYTYKLVSSSLNAAGLNGIPNQLQQRIEDGINNRARQMMRLKPMMTYTNL